MLPDRVSNPGPLTYESGALPIALRDPANSNEYHYLFICPYFADDRKLFLKPYFYLRTNILKFKDLLQTTNKTMLFKLSQFVKTISYMLNSHY